MAMSTVDRWLATWRSLGATDQSELERLHADVIARYSEPHRHYHTCQHLDECFEQVGLILHLAPHPREVEVALWFHDAVYDTRKADNEERSAAWGRAAALSAGIAPESAQRIYDLVMCTRHAAQPEGPDACVLVDTDLAILGAPQQRFEEYERQVRLEYGWVPEDLFRATRATVLSEFLARPTIYSTTRFRERYESRARTNLTASLQRLGQ